MKIKSFNEFVFESTLPGDPKPNTQPLINQKYQMPRASQDATRTIYQENAKQQMLLATDPVRAMNRLKNNYAQLQNKADLQMTSEVLGWLSIAALFIPVPGVNLAISTALSLASAGVNYSAGNKTDAAIDVLLAALPVVGKAIKPAILISKEVSAIALNTVKKSVYSSISHVTGESLVKQAALITGRTLSEVEASSVKLVANKAIHWGNSQF